MYMVCEMKNLSHYCIHFKVGELLPNKTLHTYKASWTKWCCKLPPQMCRWSAGAGQVLLIHILLCRTAWIGFMCPPGEILINTWRHSQVCCFYSNSCLVWQQDPPRRAWHHNSAGIINGTPVLYTKQSLRLKLGRHVDREALANGC